MTYLLFKHVLNNPVNGIPEEGIYAVENVESYEEVMKHHLVRVLLNIASSSTSTLDLRYPLGTILRPCQQIQSHFGAVAKGWRMGIKDNKSPGE